MNLNKIFSIYKFIYILFIFLISFSAFAETEASDNNSKLNPELDIPADDEFEVATMRYLDYLQNSVSTPYTVDPGYVEKQIKIAVSKNKYYIKNFSDTYPDLVLQGNIISTENGYKVIFNDFNPYPHLLSTFSYHYNYYKKYPDNLNGKLIYADKILDNKISFNYNPETGNIWYPSATLLIIGNNSPNFKQFYNLYYVHQTEFPYPTISIFEEIYPNISICKSVFKDNIPSMPYSLKYDIYESNNSQKTLYDNYPDFGLIVEKTDLNGNPLTSQDYVLELYADGLIVHSENIKWIYDETLNKEIFYMKFPYNVHTDTFYDYNSFYGRVRDVNNSSNIQITDNKENATHTLYDLMGNIVTCENPKPGIYIRAGKKIIIQ